MKVAVINNIYPPYDRGGAEQVVVKTVEGLLDMHHEVVVITSTPLMSKIEHHNKLTIYRIHPLNIFFYTSANEHGICARFLWHVVDIFNVQVAWQIKKNLRQEKPDVVHTHNLMGLSFLLPAIIRILNIRHIHTVHDVQLVEPSGMILKQREHSWRYVGWPSKIYTALMRILFGSPETVISPSQFLRDFYLSREFFSRSRVEVLRNPLTFPEVLSLDISSSTLLPSITLGVNGTSQDKFKKSFQTTDNQFRFLYVGQIESHKGVAELVEAFRELENSGAELHIVGGGAKLNLITDLAKNDKRIKMYGRLDRRELPAIFARMNMTVVPSLCYENSPTVIFESFAAAVPVLASDIEGIAELIRQGENGLTFPAGDVAELKNKLEWCLNNQAKVAEMGKQTTKSLTGLSLGEYIGKLIHLYQK